VFKGTCDEVNVIPLSLMLYGQKPSFLSVNPPNQFNLNEVSLADEPQSQPRQRML
jgi:hypothetical protein